MLGLFAKRNYFVSLVKGSQSHLRVQYSIFFMYEFDQCFYSLRIVKNTLDHDALHL